MFFLISPETDAAQHLRILAQIAGRVDHTDFVKQWRRAHDGHALKASLLRDERSVSLHLRRGSRREAFIDKAIRDCDIPDNCLVVMISRAGQSIVPRGSTLLRRGDLVTIIGEPNGIADLYRKFVDDGRESSDIDLHRDRDEMEPLGSV